MNFIKNKLFSKTAAAIACSTALFSMQPVLAAFDQNQLQQLAENTQLKFGTLDNFVEGRDKHLAVIELENNSKLSIPAGVADWAIYFHSIRNVETQIVEGLKIENVTGDLHRVVPTQAFKGLKPGGKLRLPHKAAVWRISYSDYMPRAFFTSQSLSPVIISNTNTETLSDFVLPLTEDKQLLKFDGFVISTVNAASRYQDYQQKLTDEVAKEQALKRIIPKPLKADFSRGFAELTDLWKISYSGRLKSEVTVFQQDLKEDFLIELEAHADHIKTQKDKLIRVSVDESIQDGKAESYTLKVDKKGIEIIGSDNAGAFYGLQSLLALIAPNTVKQAFIPRVKIEDSPRYHWRGMHYDNGRNFHGKEAIYKLIEQMAHYKLNKLHLHFSEDEGWRLEIPGLPELTEIGAFRCFDPEEKSCLMTQLGTGPHKSGTGNGFISRDEFVEILKYAKDRHVQVIPEIESPGHARAAIKAMEVRYHRLMEEGKPEQAKAYLLTDFDDKSQYRTVQNYTDASMNVCLPSTYSFLEKVTYELQQMYREAGTKLEHLHFGGDEVGKGSWTASPVCDALFAKPENGVAGPEDLKPYFTQKVAEIFHKRGLVPGAWEDGLMYDKVNTFNRESFPNDEVFANVWDNIWEWGVADRAYRLANEDYQVVLSHATHLYFDHPYEAHPEERGYYWATRSTDTFKTFSYMPDNVYANADFTLEGTPIENLEDLVGRAMPLLEKPENILGIQGQIWTETIRTEEQVLAMLFPRVLAVAERAWHKANWEGETVAENKRGDDWSEFSSALSYKELPKLIAKQVNVNLPVPGAVIEQGKLKANVPYAGLRVEYSVDQGQSWQVYQQPVNVSANQAVLLRSVSGTSFSRTTHLK